MRRTVSLLFLLGLLFSGMAQAKEQRPNVLFIFLDDFGWKDVGYMGSDFYETPHLDKLAAEGMIFSDAYSCSANCAPARACLLSGQYTPRHEVYNVGTGPRGNAKHRKLLHIPGTTTLREDIVTWAHCIQKAGYKTATMGKWHLSKDPLPYGFDLNVGGTQSGGPPRGYFSPHGSAPGLQNSPEGEYVTDRLSDEAIKFIGENKENNWFLYLTHFAVHTPIQAKKEDIAKFQAKKPGKLHSHAVMAGMIKSVDDGVGRIVAALEEMELTDNTAIFFFSDNGGYGPATSMHPLKGYKGTYYEGGIREPFFVKWPGVVKPGTRCADPIIGVDMYPTFCEITGAKPPKKQPLDGVSLMPLLEGAASLGREAIYWHFPAYLQSYARNDEQRDPLFRSRPCSIIRAGDYKLHEYFEDGGLELYNLREDIGESKDLSKSMPKKVKELHGMLKSWRAGIKAPVPDQLNPVYDAEVDAKARKAAVDKGKGKKDKKNKKG
ncbi:MAG: aryl-sulfate sulfohydrolase [Opitutae bacterium]|nr:aryl-sulfate sulfohydrolase [Opitutae bacterium]